MDKLGELKMSACLNAEDYQRQMKEFYKEENEKLCKGENSSFPEKWCILVTEDNYQEINIWMHRNWGRYEGYTDLWSVQVPSFDYMNYYFVNDTNF